MNVIKKITSIITYLLTITMLIILLIAIYSFIQIKILHKNYLNLFGFTFLQVASGSMEPEIHVNDIVIDKLIKQNEELKVGDIVSFEEENSIITHRIVGIGDDKIITKGDANNTQDESINKSQIIGKTVKIITGVSIWMKVISTKSVYVMIIITFVLFIITISIDTNENKVEDIDEKDKQ